jgi:uncharacterized protein YidB (DUF937 family)
MGLLDDLLSGLAEPQASGQRMGTPMNQPQAQPGGAGMSMVMKALLPLVIAMLANRSGGGQQPGFGQGGRSAGFGQGGGSPGFGLDDLLGGLFGGQGGEGGLGGLGAILGQLQRAGFGEQAQSWVGRGQNMPLPPGALEQVFGSGGLAEIARRAGVSEADASQGLARLLPEVVDHVTPNGEEPTSDALTASLDALSRRYGVA